MQLAVMHEEGRGVKRDYVVAFQGFQKVAAMGLNVAQYRLAKMYELGRGTDKDLTLAYVWYVRAVNSGHTTAVSHQDNLAKELSSDQLAKALVLLGDNAN